MPFANVLKALRTRRGITQKQLADVLGLSESAIGMYERAQCEPELETLEAIADYFNVDMDYLMGRSDVERKTPVTPLDSDAHPLQLDDFTFAMHHHSGALTEKDKEILLAMAQQLSAAHKKGSNGETDGDL